MIEIAVVIRDWAVALLAVVLLTIAFVFLLGLVAGIVSAIRARFRAKAAQRELIRRFVAEKEASGEWPRHG